MIFHTRTFQLFSLTAMLCSRVQAKCEGVMIVSADAPEIPDMSAKDQTYHPEVGRISYSLDSAGTLELTSTTPGFNCGPITNFVSSNATSKTPVKDPSAHKSSRDKKESQDPVQSVGAQLHCARDPDTVGVDLMTPWQTITFYGSLFFQIEMKNNTCAKPAELVLDYSRCSYNATTNTGRQGSAIPCKCNMDDITYQRNPGAKMPKTRKKPS
ncbi:hypothetical protein PSTG_08449 [Puccinia striiformis f. sp. tritici PST-78]|uniref:Uncharacterized protein n=1 Tax=Puccinia striiformis f. sp. tritici PST-78 TaxID=1165861 RepID=A0A0L0VFW7_9BASI|nr:hypothetical protein PSTG_08449 [Puccinia striiformis f. sp. tritici PST-78]